MYQSLFSLFLSFVLVVIVTIDDSSLIHVVCFIFCVYAWLSSLSLSLSLSLSVCLLSRIIAVFTRYVHMYA